MTEKDSSNEKEVTGMREGYKKLDKSKLNNRIHKTISTKEALSQVTPLEFIEDVYNGTKKVQIDKRGYCYIKIQV